MKKRLMVVMLICISTGTALYISKSEDIEPTTILPTPTTPAGHRIENYSYEYFRINPEQEVRFIENYIQREATTDIIKNNNCLGGINGGFYDEKNRPLGWVKVNDKIVSKAISSRLFNGFIGYRNRQIFIEDTVIENAEFVFQTGPVLMKNGIAQPLQMATDKQARRMVLAADNRNKPFLLVIFNESAPLLGPNLADLPGLVAKIGENEGWGIISAINLDGGNASAFYSSEVFLKENVPVGAWLCVKLK